jgi:predicted CoA-binding protein
MNDPETIRAILENTRIIAVVGLSDNPDRASHSVSSYMQRQGYRIVPVNPGIAEVLGEKSFPSLDAATAAVGKIDLVNVFRAPQFVPMIVEDVLRLEIPFLWLQQGVCHEEAAAKADVAGVRVVMDRCVYLEHAWFSKSWSA